MKSSVVITLVFVGAAMILGPLVFSYLYHGEPPIHRDTGIGYSWACFLDLRHRAYFSEPRVRFGASFRTAQKERGASPLIWRHGSPLSKTNRVLSSARWSLALQFLMSSTLGKLPFSPVVAVSELVRVAKQADSNVTSCVDDGCG